MSGIVESKTVGEGRKVSGTRAASLSSPLARTLEGPTEFKSSQLGAYLASELGKATKLHCQDVPPGVSWVLQPAGWEVSRKNGQTLFTKTVFDYDDLNTFLQ